MRIYLLVAMCFCALVVRGQTPPVSHAGMDMSSMNATGMDAMNLASGSAVNPAAWSMPMVMNHFGAWNTTFMGTAFVVDTQQSGARGHDKLYSANWMMATAQHRAGAQATLQFDIMLSLEPATITSERYPLLFQTGETAYGKPLVDAQHPHNFVMAAGVHYVRHIAENTTLELYAAPVGDPALGPVAFAHRASAAELPQAPLSHHWQDSTHIVYDVVTAGVAFNKMKLEASGFHGAEPGENRWTVRAGAIDSWAGRLWFFPTSNWAAQVSVGRIAHPEALEAGDQVRATASLHYSRAVAGGSWSSSFIWGRNHNTATRRDSNSYLAETVFPVTRKDFVTGRVERVEKDELGDGVIHTIGAYTVGYTRDVNLFQWIETGVGANFNWYSVPDAIKPVYGNHPVGGNIFVRLRVRSAGK